MAKMNLAEETQANSLIRKPTFLNVINNQDQMNMKKALEVGTSKGYRRASMEVKDNEKDKITSLFSEFNQVNEVDEDQFDIASSNIASSTMLDTDDDDGIISEPFTPKANASNIAIHNTPTPTDAGRLTSYYDSAEGKTLDDEYSKEAASKVHKLKQLVSLVPRLVVDRAIQVAQTSNQSEALGIFCQSYAETYDAGVLFADISGFSALAEKLAKSLNNGAHAAEDLSGYVGTSLQKMVKLICDMGGDVVKFAGDAILVRLENIRLF
jgi:hypothetical protein